MQLKEMDQKVSIREQLAIPQEGVVLINLFNVASEEVDALVEAWTSDALFMKKQPGFISTQLHQGIGGSSTFLNYAVWESTEAFKAAFTSPEFQSKLDKYPDSATATPHLFSKVAIPNICVKF